MMAVRVMLAGAVLAAVAAAGASAQQPPPGGIDVGGTVPSVLELGITEPAGLAAFPARRRQVSIPVEVTASDAPTQLSIAPLSAPIEAAVGRSPFQRLDAPEEPVLTQWSKPVTKAASVVRLRQRIDSRSGGSYLLITVSAETP